MKPADDNTRDSRASMSRKKRWGLRIVVGILLLLIVLVALLPTLLSTGMVRQAVVRAVNENIRGSVTIDDLSLGWFSSAKITGIRVTDNLHPEAVTIGSITWDKGIISTLSMLRSLDNLDIGRLTIDGIDGVVYVNEDGSNSLQNAFAPRQTPTQRPPTPPSSETSTPTGETPAPPPDKTPAPAADQKPFNLRAKLEVTNCRIRLVKFDGRQMSVTDLNTVADLNYPQSMTLTHTSTHDGGGKLVANVKLQHLASSSGNLLDVLTGEAKIHTEPAIDLGPAITFFAPPATKGQGLLKLNIDGEFAPGTAGGKYLLAVTGLSLSDDAVEVKAVSQEFTGTMAYKDRRLTVDNKGTGLVNLAANLNYNTAGPNMPEKEILIDLLMQGKSFPAPDASLDLNGKVDLAALSRALPGIVKLQEGVELENGTLTLDDIAVRGGEKPFTKGKMVLAVAIKRDGKATVFEPVKIGWGVLTNEQGKLQIEQDATGVTSSFATVNVGGTIDGLTGSFSADLAKLREQLSQIVDLENTELGGKVKGTLAVDVDAADAKLHKLALRITADDVVAGSRAPAETADQPADTKATPPAEPTHISGTLTWHADARYDNEKLDLRGQADISGLKLSPTGDVLDGDAPTLVHDLTFDNKSQRLDLHLFSLTSRVLNIADFTGSITRLDTDKMLNLTGSYSADWKELTALVERFKPAAMDGILMQARSAGPVAVTGPLNAPTITPLNAGTDIGWGKGSRVYGIDFGDAKLQPKLAGGVFALPLAEIPANDGMLRLKADVNLNGTEPVLNIPGQVHMMDKIAINADMGKYLLSRAVPLLAETTKLEGLVSLMVRDIDLPLGESMMTSGSGGGRLDLSEIRLSPAGEIARLITLIGLDANKSYPVTIGAVDFQLKEGALAYDNMTVTIAGMELRIRGRVKFNDDVELIVAVPVKREMIEALGIKGATAAKIPDNLYVDIPLVGSRTKPKLDLDRIDKEALLKDVLKGVGLDNLGNLLGGSKDTTAQPDGAKDSKDGQLKDALKGVAGGLLGGGNTEPATQPTTQPTDATEQKPSALPIKLPSLPIKK